MDLLGMLNNKNRLNVRMNDQKGLVNIYHKTEDGPYGVSYKDILIQKKSDSAENAYYLPWKSDTGFYIEIPKKDPESRLFLTANLTGCFVGVVELGDCIKIAHYNFAEFEAHPEDFSFYKYWLMPGNKTTQLGFDGDPCVVKYTYGGAGNFTTFFGEYDVDELKWKFYYQNDGNTTVRPFKY